MQSLNSKRKTSVLFISHSGELGGGELSLFDIAREVVDSEVILLSKGPFFEKLREANLTVDVVAAGAMLNVRRSDGIGKLIGIAPSLALLIAKLTKKAYRSRLLYANSQKAFVAGAIVSLISRRPLIWHLRDLLTTDHFSGAMRRATIILANRCANHVIANSVATADAFRAAGGRAPVTVVHSCIDPVRLEVPPASLPEALQNGPVLGVFSRIAPWKGQHVIIEALTRLPGYHLVIVGEALFGEEAYATQLSRLASELGVGDRIHFLGFRHDSPAIMRAVDIVIHSSTSPEPFGRVIVEGMLAGKPVIATAAGGALEIIKNDINGLLVPPGDANALVDAIRWLADNPDAAQALAKMGQDHALSEFSLSNSNARIISIIRSMVSI